MKTSPPIEEELPPEEAEDEDEEDKKSWRGYPKGFDPEDWGLVSFWVVKNMEEARQLKQCLEQPGIPSYFGPDVLDDLRLLPQAFERMGVKVRKVDIDRAYPVMKQCAPPADDEEQVDFTVHCPHCHSTEVVLDKFSEANEETRTGPKYKWTCAACGHHGRTRASKLRVKRIPA